MKIPRTYTKHNLQNGSKIRFATVICYSKIKLCLKRFLFQHKLCTIKIIEKPTTQYQGRVVLKRSILRTDCIFGISLK